MFAQKTNPALTITSWMLHLTMNMMNIIFHTELLLFLKYHLDKKISIFHWTSTQHLTFLEHAETSVVLPVKFMRVQILVKRREILKQVGEFFDVNLISTTLTQILIQQEFEDFNLSPTVN